MTLRKVTSGGKQAGWRRDWTDTQTDPCPRRSTYVDHCKIKDAPRTSRCPPLDGNGDAILHRFTGSSNSEEDEEDEKDEEDAGGGATTSASKEGFSSCQLQHKTTPAKLLSAMWPPHQSWRVQRCTRARLPPACLPLSCRCCWSLPASKVSAVCERISDFLQFGMLSGGSVCSEAQGAPHTGLQVERARPVSSEGHIGGRNGAEGPRPCHQPQQSSMESKGSSLPYPSAGPIRSAAKRGPRRPRHRSSTGSISGTGHDLGSSPPESTHLCTTSIRGRAKRREIVLCRRPEAPESRPRTDPGGRRRGRRRHGKTEDRDTLHPSAPPERISTEHIISHVACRVRSEQRMARGGGCRRPGRPDLTRILNPSPRAPPTPTGHQSSTLAR